jgi:membrane protease YdiL (CAAX protease family)
MSIFLNEQLDLRPGWRFGLYIAVFAAMLYATGGLISIFVSGEINSQLAFLAINAIALLIPGVLALMFMIRFVDQIPLLAFGIGFHQRGLRDLIVGIVVAAGMLGVLAGSIALVGDLSITGGNIESIESTEWWLGMSVLLLILIVSAANEELIFRGYPLQVLMVAVGPGPAIVMMSMLFGLGHHLNPNATWLGTANTCLAGILLCLAYARTRSLWFPYGIHIGWNLGLGPIFGFPLSGMDIDSIWRTEADGADWLTGGAYGPEGGLLVTGIMILAIAVVTFTRQVRVSPNISSILSQHSDKVYRDSTLSSIGGS